MKGFALGLSLSIAFILGCAAAPLIVPRMSAQQQAAGVQRWEYTCPLPQRQGGDDHAAAATQLGEQGWEYSHNGWNVMCFKRPLM